MPSFGYKKANKKIKKFNKQFQERQAIKKTLRANQDAYINFISLNSFFKSFYSICQRRVSLSGSSICRGSMTVEASLIFPVFLIAVIQLFSVLDFVRLQSNMITALHQTGKKLAVYGYAYDKTGLKLEDYPLSSALFSYTFVKSSVENYLDKDDLENTVLEHGSAGIYYGYSKIMEDDIIDLVALYNVSGLFSGKGLKGIPMYNRYYGHVWNGFDVEKTLRTGSEDIYVFMAETGTVYHKDRNCTYLNLSIEAVYYEDIGKKRNNSGAIYYECELCKGNKGTVVYITEQGNRYHTTMDCSRLKRTVYSVPLSETACPPCSKCGY